MSGFLLNTMDIRLVVQIVDVLTALFCLLFTALDIDEDYYKPITARGAFSSFYIQYESKGDK